MRSNRLFISAALTLAIAACQSTPSTVFTPGDPDSEQRAVEISLDYLAKVQPNLMAGVDAVWPKRVHIDELGQAHTSLLQTIDNIPVFGGEAIVHLNANGTFRSMTDNLARGLRVDTRADLTDLEATDLAVASHGGWGRVTGTPATDLQILRRDGSAHLTYRVQIRQFEPGSTPAIPVVFIDAKTGDQLWEYDNLKSTELADGDKRTFDMGGSTSKKGKPKPLAQDTDATALQAHENVGYTLDYYFVTHDRDSFSGTGTIVDSYVHYGNDYVNAFWDGSSLNFGDGDDIMSGPLTSLDIVAHEFSHGVTDYTADLIYADESGAVNEANSDIFASAVEAYRGGSYEDIWYMGEDTWLDDPDPNDGIPAALRYMDNPGLTGDPDFYADRYTGTSDNGGVHINAGIGNLFFHLLSVGGTHPANKSSVVVSGIGIDHAAKIWYRALTVYMTASTNFSGARTATVMAAEDLFPSEVASVKQAWDAVGVIGFDTTIDEQNDLASSTSLAFGPYHVDYQAVKFAIANGTGDADLYVRIGSMPTTSEYDCRPWATGNSETCEFNPAEAGDYYVMIVAYSAFSGVDYTVTAAGAEPAPGCTTNEDCNDGNACSTDTCNAGTCEHALDASACECYVNADCDDGNSCSDDTCSAGGTCSHVLNDSCDCLDASDCNDDHICSIDTCIAGTCDYALDESSPTCECFLDSMCDDLDSCTDDSCNADGTCSNVDNGTCCSFDTDCDDGDDCTDNVCNGDGTCSFPDNGTCVCAAVGETCTTNGECCSGRCHPAKGVCK